MTWAAPFRALFRPSCGAPLSLVHHGYSANPPICYVTEIRGSHVRCVYNIYKKGNDTQTRRLPRPISPRHAKSSSSVFRATPGCAVTILTRIHVHIRIRTQIHSPSITFVITPTRSLPITRFQTRVKTPSCLARVTSTRVHSHSPIYRLTLADILTHVKIRTYVLTYPSIRSRSYAQLTLTCTHSRSRPLTLTGTHSLSYTHVH